MALRWSFLGRAPFRPVWERQQAVRERILAGDRDAQELLFVEHDPVITLGRSARAEHVLAAGGIEVIRIDRGGDVTVHGPGQLVIYPVVRLAGGVVRHVEGVGRAIAAELAARGVPAEWRRDPAGVWVGEAKIAACGVHVRRRVAIHGFALNVGLESLELFSRVVPCGLPGARVTALAEHLEGPLPSLAALAEALAPRIASALG